MQIVAHCDDDLYFMNPALHHAISAGAPITSVYLTAGEADGRNVAYGVPDRSSHPVDHAGYAAARRNGIRSAYAEMATGDRDSPWRTEPARYAGVNVDVAVLIAVPRIRLVFVSLVGQEAATAGDPPQAIDSLWTGEIPALATLVPTGGAVTRKQKVSRDGLLDLLQEILAEARPTVVRIMDPDPDHKTYDRGEITYSDHAGHTAAAHFALHAVRRFERSNGRFPLVESYRGYYNRHWPRNLTEAAFATKRQILDTYGGTHGDRTAEIGCGDYLVGDQAHTTGYGQSTTQRYPGSASWLRLQPNGRLAAFAVIAGDVHLWQETKPGARTWTEPVRLGGGDLAPHLDVVAGPDGRLHLVGVRQPLTPSPRGQHRTLVVASQAEPNGSFGGWTELGNPAGRSADRTLRMREMGMPVAAVRPDGMLQVFVRNFGRGVSSRTQTGPKSWGPWSDLGGSRVQEGLAVATGRSGRLSLFAGTNNSVLVWNQEEDGSFAPPAALLRREATGPVSVAREHDGRLLLVYRAGGHGEVTILRQAREGAWPTVPAVIDGEGGFGPVAAFSAPGKDGETLLAHRNDQGTLSVSRQPTGKGMSQSWSAAGAMFVRTPAIATDAAARFVIAALGVDGVLRVARGSDDFSEWVALPSAGAAGV
ncbi:PIG-L family deacetylase [Amorphoplanes digitatis]|uniref:LmbE family N-acetylglucosaminyl deacetylase n=1 Tax=Actinoplanes digitatis TaxID=1868 RepID=A0A7W7HYJ8_9ACTN|nr:PIG-L family deacetylase [Actinoplanes digitatis]MBB4763152.1 LmbE family N-acetylglucosaminyl deacetylase [Actinoplanes digitatis]